MPRSPTALELEHFARGGARIGVTDTAVPAGAEGWNLVIPSMWTDPATTDDNIAWTRETHRALGLHLDEAHRRQLNAGRRQVLHRRTPGRRYGNARPDPTPGPSTERA